MSGFNLKRLNNLKKTQVASPRNQPVVFGDQVNPTQTLKGSTMSLSNSRYVKKPGKNPWREVILSESNLIVALEFALRQSTHLKPSEVIERVITGEPSNGQYPLSVAIKKREVNGKSEP